MQRRVALRVPRGHLGQPPSPLCLARSHCRRAAADGRTRARARARARHVVLRYVSQEGDAIRAPEEAGDEQRKAGLGRGDAKANKLSSTFDSDAGRRRKE